MRREEDRRDVASSWGRILYVATDSGGFEGVLVLLGSLKLLDFLRGFLDEVGSELRSALMMGTQGLLNR